MNDWERLLISANIYKGLIIISRKSLHHLLLIDVYPTSSKENRYLYLYNFEVHTAWKVLIFRVFLVRIFPHLDWIQKDTPNLSLFSQNAEKYAPEKLRIWTLFRHCWELFYLIMLKVVLKLKKHHRIFDKIIFRTIHRI